MKFSGQTAPQFDCIQLCCLTGRNGLPVDITEWQLPSSSCMAVLYLRRNCLCLACMCELAYSIQHESIRALLDQLSIPCLVSYSGQPDATGDPTSYFGYSPLLILLKSGIFLLSANMFSACSLLF